jgi:hypothetical protein
MAVIGITEEMEGRRSSSADSTETRVFIVETDSKTDGPRAARLADLGGGNAVPRPGDQYPGVTGVYVKKDGVTAEPRQGSPTVFTVTVVYSYPPPGGEAALDEDPLARPPEVSWTGDAWTEPRYVDAEGNPMNTSAGEQFDPPLETAGRDPILHYADNVDDFDERDAIAYAYAVNLDTFQAPRAGGGFITIAPGEAKLMMMDGASAYENGTRYVKRSIEIHFRKKVYDSDGSLISGWIDLVQDQGYMELVDPPAGADPQYDSSGSEVTPEKVQRVILDEGTPKKPKNTPTNLNGRGQPLAMRTHDPDTGLITHAGEPPVFRKFKNFVELPFFSLGLRPVDE